MKSQYEYQVEYHQEQRSNEPILKTPEDRHRWAMFVEGNKYLINGRTFNFVDEHGEHISTFVSQYSDIIDNNIEPFVKDAVRGLNEKGYLTYTSCQGHADSLHRYIGVVFNSKAQKNMFMYSVRHLKCDVHFYDNAINTVERPWTPVPWWSDAIRLHIVYDDEMFSNSSIADRRDKPYTDQDLTNFWNIQMNRNYDHYESIIMTFGYPMIEANLWERVKKLFFYNHYRVTSAYYDFCNKLHKLEEYDA